ncbi:cell division protein FtsA [Erysipelothrix sp. HDW6C]|uniref:cell division protein FtsA n=1 Tax=Erysipelothrix sp. HDW6C TaxID=2714930 RepID=UPI00140BEE03|nr:cell division protein FtsA [Erysipelothrix sp. HDW6C]QIK70223.1 cell division protein FtsA [Erysipelothrix sp. HDW6C]
MEKQIIAALEIADHEVRLLVGQFFNGRLNILKVERVAHLGVAGYAIMSETHVVDSIKKAVENASRNLGVVVKRVLLLVPGIHTKRVNRQIRVPIAGRIAETDIRHAYKELKEASYPEGYILTNILFSKFFVNGSSTRKLPLNEKSDSLTIEAECYYGKQSIIFPYVTAVEKSGLQIIDIITDDIGFAKEASLFEASIDKPVIGLTLNEKMTRMSLFYQGVLVSNDYIDAGFDTFMKKIETTLKVPSDVVHRLLYFNVDLDEASPGQDPIFMWSTKSTTHTLSQQDLMELVADDIRAFIADILDRCEPIFELGEPRFVISGEASEIDGVTNFIKKQSVAEAVNYRSTTFGVKDPGLTSLVGAFYLYKDHQIYRERSFSSVDEDEFKRIVIQYNQDDKDDSITQKLKNMFFERKLED